MLPKQGAWDLIPGWGIKIPHAAQCSHKIKKKKKQNQSHSNLMKAKLAAEVRQGTRIFI